MLKLNSQNKSLMASRKGKKGIRKSNQDKHQIKLYLSSSKLAKSIILTNKPEQRLIRRLRKDKKLFYKIKNNLKKCKKILVIKLSNDLVGLTKIIEIKSIFLLHKNQKFKEIFKRLKR